MQLGRMARCLQVCLVLAMHRASASRHYELTEDRIGPFPADIFESSYHNYVFRDGCFPRGSVIWQGDTQVADFPKDNMKYCSAHNDCSGFQVYIKPQSSVQSIFIEYKRNCVVLPQESCDSPFGQSGGGIWYSMISSVRCAGIKPERHHHKTSAVSLDWDDSGDDDDDDDDDADDDDDDQERRHTHRNRTHHEHTHEHEHDAHELDSKPPHVHNHRNRTHVNHGHDEHDEHHDAHERPPHHRRNRTHTEREHHDVHERPPHRRHNRTSHHSPVRHEPDPEELCDDDDKHICGRLTKLKGDKLDEACAHGRTEYTCPHACGLCPEPEASEDTDGTGVEVEPAAVRMPWQAMFTELTNSPRTQTALPAAAAVLLMVNALGVISRARSRRLRGLAAARATAA